jgi:hypothetical protein
MMMYPSFASSVAVVVYVSSVASPQRIFDIVVVEYPLNSYKKIKMSYFHSKRNVINWLIKPLHAKRIYVPHVAN